MVHWHVEEALLLVGVQIHRNHAVNACHAKHVGHKFRTDADTWLALAVLTCPTEVGDDGINGAG